MTKSLRILCLSLVAIISSVSFGIEYTSAVKVPTENDIAALLGTESVSQYENLAKAIAAAKEVAAGEWTDFMAYQLEALNKLIEEAEQMYEEASANDEEVVTMIAELEEASAHVELDNIYILFDVYIEKIDEIKVGNEPGQCTQSQKDKAGELLDLVACALADAEEENITAIEAKELCMSYFSRIDQIIANSFEYSEFPIFLHGAEEPLPNQIRPYPVLEGAYEINIPAGVDKNGKSYSERNNVIEYESQLFHFREPLEKLRFIVRAVGSPTEVDKNGNPHICISGFAMFDEEGNEIELTTENVVSNATENEGQGIPGLLDYNPSTFFHSLWRTGISEPHYIEVTLPKGKYSAFSFKMLSFENSRSRTFPRELEITNVETNENTTSYTLTYMVDGEIYHTESLHYGASITAPEPPTKEGYTFSGWEGLPETMPNEDIMVSANFLETDDVPILDSEWIGTTINGDFSGYLYNTSAKAFLGAGNSWGTQASFVEVGLNFDIVEEQNLYTIKGALCHYSNPNYCHLGANGYLDQAPANHVITCVGKSLYTIQQGGMYYAYKAGSTVLQKVDQLNENCYWKFISRDERRSKYANATTDNPADATFEIPSHNFGYENTGVKEWTGEPSFGGEWANFVAYKNNTKNCEISTVLRDMPDGVYRLKVQGFYRQGTPEAAVEARKNGTEINPAKFFANNASVTVKNILDEAGKNTISEHGVDYGDYGKAPKDVRDASAYFDLGFYEHTLEFSLEEGVSTIKIGLIKEGGVENDWVVMDNYRLEYLGGYKNNANISYTLTYMENDTTVYHADWLSYGETITAPEPPKKAGYSFVGWEGLPETMPAENITVTAKYVKINPDEIPAKDGEWLFDNPNNLYLCTEGSIDLIPYKVGAKRTAPTTFAEGEDTGIEKTEEGIYLPKTTCLFMDLNETDQVRNYTLVYDLRLKDMQDYTGLFQTNLQNNSDSRLFITKGKLGVNAGGLGYGGEIIANQWHRVAIVVEDGIISTYIDGLHVGTSQNTNNDFWCLDKEGVFLFLDDDGESTDVEVAGIHFWKQVLSDAQIEALGGEENMDDSKEYSLNFSKSANVVRTDRLLQSIAVSDDRGDVNTIAVNVAKPYISKVYDEGSTLICKVGAPLSVTFDCQGSGLNSYVYIDLEDDKQFSFNEGQTDQSGTDVMAYSFYSGSFDDDSEGVNSAGDVLTGDSRYTMICPTFNAPTEAGVYRIRFKTDWNSIDAGGQLAADGTCTGTNGFLANGGTIVDATLRVLGDFTVTYMVDGKVYHTEKVGYKDLISLPEPPTKEGYTFKEWDGIPETMPGNDIIVTGVFIANNYQITYMLDGEVYYTDSVACGEKIPTVTPTREGYTFNGWEGLPETMQANDLVVEGSFSVNNYTITYMVDGKSYKTTSYAYSDTIVVEAEPQKEGYTFSGWDEVPETMPANHITISGTFIINDYQITYMVDGEQYYSDFITYKEKIIPIDSPTKEGHTFNGWEGLPETMPAHDLVINGSFTVNSYTITYMLDGKVYKTVTYNYGETIVPEESPQTTGYVFSGWLGLPETMPAEDLIIVGVLAALDGNYTDDQGVQYTLEDNKEGYAVSGISKSAASDIVIPAEVNDLPVTVIDERAFIAVENMQSVVIPSNITTVGKNVFYGCKNLLLVEWNTTAPVRADCFDKAENHGNMLVFVNDADTEVSYKGNVVVNGVAEQITISDDMAFRSPQQFTARKISFTRNFDKKTKIGVSGGWEAMVLPFDVQTVTNEKKETLLPFGLVDFESSLPYWAAELQADETFSLVQQIKANTPFIMQVPNSDEYEDRYNVAGEVTFSATDVTVYPTTDMEQEVGNGYVMLGSYEGTTADSRVYALNDEEYTADGETYMSGSIFVANARDIRPFEAYVYTTDAGRAPYLRVGNAGETGIGHSTFNVQHSTEIYDLTGRKVLNTANLKGGIYIVNGKKVIFK